MEKITPIECLKEIVLVRLRILNRALDASEGVAPDEIDFMRIELLNAQLQLAQEEARCGAL